MDYTDKLQLSIIHGWHYIKELFHMSAFKAITATAIAASTFVFEPNIIRAGLVACLLFPILDMITGIMAAHKNGEKIASRPAGKILSKITTYTIMCVVAKEANGFITDFGFAQNAVVGLIMATEGYSIYENCLKMGYLKVTSVKKLIAKLAK
jgi:phage-related holin